MAQRVGRRIRITEEDLAEFMQPEPGSLSGLDALRVRLLRPTALELEQRRESVNRILSRRDAMSALDITTTELVECGRREHS